MPEIDFDQVKNYVRSIAYLIITAVCVVIAVEALALRTFNLALLQGLTALLQLF
jgi:hypothetical protein